LDLPERRFFPEGSPWGCVAALEPRYTQDMPVDSQIQERRGEAFELEARLTVIGRKLRPGESAPPFTLECFDTDLCAIKIVRLADSEGQVRLLNVVNSLDTPVCDVETQKWEERRAQLSKDVQLMTISMDLPFAQARWCEAADVGHQALSAHNNEQFGRDYGVLIKEWRLLQRAVFVLDRAGRVVYADYVPDQMAEPDYAVAIAAVRALN
jgi:thiol peroxidase